MTRERQNRFKSSTSNKNYEYSATLEASEDIEPAPGISLLDPALECRGLMVAALLAYRDY